MPCPVIMDNYTVPQLVSEMREDPGGIACPIEGGRTAPWFLTEAVSATGMTFLARHHRWMATSGVRPASPICYEHEMLSTALDLGCTHDRLNLKNLTMVEWMCRRLQLQESAVVESPDNPSFEGARHFMGYGERRGGALISPSLQAHVASALGREAAIMKEKRKAKEVKGGGKHGPGRGKGHDPAAAGPG